MHLIHRNRVDTSRLSRLEPSPLRSNLLANIFPSGARLILVALIDKYEQDGHNHCLHHNGQPNEKDARRKPCPAGEGGPQRKKNANTWSDFLTRLRWMRCITRTLFHIFANAKGAELMTQPPIFIV